MVIRAEIIENIEQIVAGDYTRWTIGLTEDPDRRKEGHKNPAMWYQWQADSQLNAKYIEMYFQGKGMWGFPADGEEPTYIYIFQLKETSRVRR
jgi:hypothetical protein